MCPLATTNLLGHNKHLSGPVPPWDVFTRQVPTGREEAHGTIFGRAEGTVTLGT